MDQRVWRARRRHDHIDAVLHDRGAGWDLAFLRNDRPLVIWRFTTRDDAVGEAAARLRDLQRAGWNVHW